METDNNKKQILDRPAAYAAGFTEGRESILEHTGWSMATLGRKMAQMQQGADYVYVQGKTKPTPIFRPDVLKLAGIEVAEHSIGGSWSEGRELVKTGPGGLSQDHLKKRGENLKKNSAGEMVDAIAAATVLPHKLLLTINEARQLSGLPKWFLADRVIKIRRRNYIRAGDLEKLTAAFLKLK